MEKRNTAKRVLKHFGRSARAESLMGKKQYFFSKTIFFSARSVLGVYYFANAYTVYIVYMVKKYRKNGVKAFRTFCKG